MSAPPTKGEELTWLTREGLDLTTQLARESLSSWRTRISNTHPLLWGQVYAPQWMEHASPPFHWDMLGAALEHNRVAVAAPRGFAKTTLFTKFLPCWSVFAQGPEVNEILLLSATGAMAESWLDQIKNLLENSEEIKADWGDVRGEHWGGGDLEVVLRRDGKVLKRVYIRARGRGCQVRGMRPWWVILDDVDNEETVNSEKMREDLWDWYWGALIPTLDTPDKKIVTIGTAISVEALIVKLIDSDKTRDGWFMKTYEALIDEQSVWPERYPTAQLHAKRVEIGAVRFAQEFMNAPMGKRGKAFSWKHIKEEDEFDVSADGFLTMCVDPAVSGLGDPWAITIVDQSARGLWYVLEAINDKAGLDKLIEEIFRLQARYRTRAIGVETSAFQTSMKWILEDQSRRRGVHLPIVPLTHTSRKSKHQRIMGLFPLFEAGRIIMKRAHTALRGEILNYPRGHDDLIDCLASHLDVQRAPRMESPPPEKPKGLTMADLRSRPKSWHTPPGKWDKFLPAKA